jgi:hypothetical protein
MCHVYPYLHAVHFYDHAPESSDIEGVARTFDCAASYGAVTQSRTRMLLRLETQGDHHIGHTRLPTNRKLKIDKEVGTVQMRVARAPLIECSGGRVGRDVGTSSVTAAAVVTAAEIYLRMLGDLRPEEHLSVESLEEFTTVFNSRQSLTTLYHTLLMAHQIGFLRESHVDQLTNRFLGTSYQWRRSVLRMGEFLFLNKEVEHQEYAFDPDAVSDWLRRVGPVVARVDPRALFGMAPKPDAFAHHAVAIIGENATGTKYVALTNWGNLPRVEIAKDAPSEGWGLCFKPAPPRKAA